MSNVVVFFGSKIGTVRVVHRVDHDGGVLTLLVEGYEIATEGGEGFAEAQAAVDAIEAFARLAPCSHTAYVATRHG